MRSLISDPVICLNSEDYSTSCPPGVGKQPSSLRILPRAPGGHRDPVTGSLSYGIIEAVQQATSRSSFAPRFALPMAAMSHWNRLGSLVAGIPLSFPLSLGSCTDVARRANGNLGRLCMTLCLTASPIGRRVYLRHLGQIVRKEQQTQHGPSSACPTPRAPPAS